MRSRWSLRRKTLARESTALSRWIAQQLIDKGFIAGCATDYCIRRTYAGHHQRSSGAWVWTLEVIDLNNYAHPERARNIGSQYPATEIRQFGLDADECLGGLDICPAATVAVMLAARAKKEVRNVQRK